MKNKIKILHVLGDLNIGGIESLLISIFNNIDRDEFEFDFLVHSIGNDQNLGKIEKLGGKVYTIDKFNPKNPFKYKKDFENFLYNHKEYQILHCHFRGTESTILKVAKKYGLTTISHIHGLDYGSGIKKIIRDCLKKDIIKYSDYKFACSIEAGELMFKNNKFTLIKNGIDLEKYIYNEDIRNEIREKLDLNENKVMVHIGSFLQLKNQKFLIYLMKDLVKIDNKIILLLVGDGYLKEESDNLTKKLNLESNIKFLGSISNVNEILQAADLFLLPSLNEGLPLSAVEAQSAGLKCLLSDSIPKDVKLTENVEFISLNDKEKWKEMILDSFIYQRKNLYKTIDDKGFNIKNTCKYLENFYKSIV